MLCCRYNVQFFSNNFEVFRLVLFFRFFTFHKQHEVRVLVCVCECAARMISWWIKFSHLLLVPFHLLENEQQVRVWNLLACWFGQQTKKKSDLLTFFYFFWIFQAEYAIDALYIVHCLPIQSVPHQQNQMTIEDDSWPNQLMKLMNESVFVCILIGAFSIEPASNRPNDRPKWILYTNLVTV